MVLEQEDGQRPLRSLLSRPQGHTEAVEWSGRQGSTFGSSGTRLGISETQHEGGAGR